MLDGRVHVSDLSDYDADIDPAKVGSEAESALRTDEPAEANLEDQDATRQGGGGYIYIYICTWSMVNGP